MIYHLIRNPRHEPQRQLTATQVLERPNALHHRLRHRVTFEEHTGAHRTDQHPEQRQVSHQHIDSDSSTTTSAAVSGGRHRHAQRPTESVDKHIGQRRQSAALQPADVRHDGASSERDEHAECQQPHGQQIHVVGVGSRGWLLHQIEGHSDRVVAVPEWHGDRTVSLLGLVDYAQVLPSVAIQTDGEKVGGEKITERVMFMSV